ncbi:uncharacterized protein LOC113215924 [Frankliniella occidentalis]|uniref:Uncharacterized protein LOC113215924 n=1 Tax=Frankliniella occidentalis TaxID=133901 RepID=A0A9C6WUV3_FRAOC|nr:uncharacterized protein LOC113215924 [Frankliniella occidentalis]
MLPALCLLGSALGSALADVMVKEVPAGAMAELECPSNDDHHRFSYWQTHNDKVIGPGNEYNDYKYKYEVLTGKLFIKGVSTSEAGFYKCVSRAVSADPANIKIENVELIVRKDWEEVYEDDTETNTFRAVAALSVILVALLLLLFFLRMRRTRPLRFRDLIDEESQDEAPAAVAAQARADVYRPTTLPSSSSNGGAGGSSAKDNLAVAVDTDFPTVFESIHDPRM